MTGREFILYILSNGLEDESLFENGKLLGFMTPMEAAVKFGVGVETVRVWCVIGRIPSIKIEGAYFIPALAKKPETGGNNA